MNCPDGWNSGAFLPQVEFIPMDLLNDVLTPMEKANMAGWKKFHHLSRWKVLLKLRGSSSPANSCANLQRQWFLQNCYELTGWLFFLIKEKTTSSLEKKPQILTGFGCVEAHRTFSLQMNKRHSNHCRGSSIGMSLWPFFFCQAKECVGEGVNNAQGTHFRCWLGNVENFLMEMVWFETIGGNGGRIYNTAKALR